MALCKAVSKDLSEVFFPFIYFASLIVMFLIWLFSNETYTVRYSYMQENRIYSIQQQKQYPVQYLASYNMINNWRASL